MLALDNPAALSDRLSLAVSRTLGFGGRRQIGNITGHYSVPMGYWLLGISTSDSRSQQRVACQRRHYCYAGHQRNLDLQLAWVLHRNRTAKTTVSGGGLLSQSHHQFNQVPCTRKRAVPAPGDWGYPIAVTFTPPRWRSPLIIGGAPAGSACGPLARRLSAPAAKRPTSPPERIR